ncbi:acyltransferase family protein [Luteibacter sp. UNCMF366Tsu5.1]|uniref:acyltransferase family protein n=1 Tax=Luteibacter sp. UNCMF366Tsu5.1 TaxID=1502758 RepID=UPI00090917AA|nr:acyltransferase [Luteibacter sp. UNCMF366Tsu5.1]SFW40798.1 Peptidoglycan/LPS O-acetylase OafA/YrhL, contains acyltransferase and SGNH-hydrolase domains [Luteibacter sp. UNCMF366Tsu5.1]
MSSSSQGKTLLFGVGSWRLLLAVLVAASHLWSSMVQGYAAYAVWAFFVLSGYLMTFVIKHKYGFSRVGLRDFAFNRFLRIYPSYFMALVAGLLVIWWAGSVCVDTTRLNPEMYMPHGWGWLNPISLLPIFPHNGLPVAVSNALSVEVGAYFLMPLMARSKSTAWLAVVLSVVVTFNLGFATATFAERYVQFLPCLMSFAAGSLVCHYREVLLRFAMPRVSFLIWMIHGALWLKWDPWPWTYGMYTSLILSAWVTLSLTAYKSSKMDALLGDTSYPMYLIHTTVGACFLVVFGYGRGLRYFLVVFVVASLLSILMALFVERPLHRFKRSARVHDKETSLAQQ